MLWILALTGGVLWLLANFWLKPLYFRNRFYWTGGAIVVLFVASFFYPALLSPVKIFFYAWVILIFSDIIFLFLVGGKPAAKRNIADRLSNGDRNPVTLEIKNNYPFKVSMQVVDELPVQFQARQHVFKKKFNAGE